MGDLFGVVLVAAAIVPVVVVAVVVVIVVLTVVGVEAAVMGVEGAGKRTRLLYGSSCLFSSSSGLLRDAAVVA